MSVSAYVLIQAEVGKSVQVADQVARIDGIVSAENVTVPTTSSSGPRPSRWTTSAAWW